jgi:hypothetical protein
MKKGSGFRVQSSRLVFRLIPCGRDVNFEFFLQCLGNDRAVFSLFWNS